MQPPGNMNELMNAIDTRISPIARQLEKMEERMEGRTRDLATRTDLDTKLGELRREVVARESLEPRLAAMTAMITRVEQDRMNDRLHMEQEMAELRTEQLSRQDRLWIRLSQLIAVAGFALALFELLAHFKFTP